MNPDCMEIKALRREQLDTVADVSLKAYDGWSRDDVRKYLEKFQSFEPECCMVAVDDGGEVIGAILGYSYRRREDLILFIQELFVAPDQRHQGCGRRLVEALRASFEKNPKVSVTPLVKADTSVLNFYNSLGFEHEQSVSFYGE